MGLLDLFKKKEVPTPTQAPTLKDGTVKTFDYFAFKVHGVASIPDVQELLSEVAKKQETFEDPNFIFLRLEKYNNDDCLNVYFQNERIGSGDKLARDKFIEHCAGNNKWNIHSFHISGGKDGKNYGCKIKVKYFY